MTEFSDQRTVSCDGASGFIGAKVIEALLAKGLRIFDASSVRQASWAASRM
jgi:nucleoside-diphosphate-sugar epimerase